MILACFVLGLSTRKVATALQPVLGRRIRPGTVRQVAKLLNEAVVAFHRRPVKDYYPVLMLDGVVLSGETGLEALYAARCWWLWGFILTAARRSSAPSVRCAGASHCGRFGGPRLFMRSVMLVQASERRSYGIRAEPLNARPFIPHALATIPSIPFVGGHNRLGALKNPEDPGKKPEVRG